MPIQLMYAPRIEFTVGDRVSPTSDTRCHGTVVKRRIAKRDRGTVRWIQWDTYPEGALIQWLVSNLVYSKEAK